MSVPYLHLHDRDGLAERWRLRIYGVLGAVIRTTMRYSTLHKTIAVAQLGVIRRRD